MMRERKALTSGKPDRELGNDSSLSADDLEIAISFTPALKDSEEGREPGNSVLLHGTVCS